MGPAAVRRSQPDLILLDIAMPQKSGLDTQKELRADQQTQDTPIIMISAKVRSSDLNQARDLGALDYIKKPWKEGEVEERVGSLIGRGDPFLGRKAS